MNKLHMYLLPLSVGSLGVLFTPLHEQAAVSYTALVVAVVLGIVGLHSLAKEKQAQQEVLQHGLKALEETTKTSAIDYTSILKQQQGALDLTNQALQQQLDVAKTNNEFMQQQFEQLTTTLVAQVEKMESALVTAATTETTHVKQSVQSLQEKVEDGNAIVENVAILMIQEQKTTVQLLEELTALQSALPNDLAMLQDMITANQQDALDATRNVEMHLEKLADLQEIVQAHLETSATTHEQVVGKITEEFTKITTKVDTSTNQLFNELATHNKQAQEQVNMATKLIEKTDQLQVELTKANEKAAATVTKQLTELKGLNKTLVQGIGQIADSKSAERQQLLKIQKELIKEYSR